MLNNRYKFQVLIRFVLFLSFIWVFPVLSSAKHIIGGDMTYVCNGNGTYTITLKVYRDCNSGGAEYDSPAYFGIYNGPSFYEQRTATPQNITTVPPDDNPCVQITNPPCVQSATYTLSNVSLPASGLTYTVAYQRCCRNESINNIVNPGDMGVTYSVEITPESYASCNNSPVFNDFPPIVICAGQFLQFDHSASDAESDQLVYSFCSPLQGGGPNGTQDNPGDPNGPDGVQPIPPTGPPYNTVSFLAPIYSSAVPMGGDPTISIDPTTGFITGVPTAQGQYVVGVCVQEIRNGIAIGEIQRDFQFNVINCVPQVIADINEDVIIGEKEYVVNLCGDLSFDFINESVVNTPEENYEWSFDLGGGNTFTSTDEDVSVDFPSVGSYEGTLVVNPGLFCNDTAYIFINVFPTITADFEFFYDVCEAAPIQFTDLSSGDGSVNEWNWNFGDGNTSMDQNPLYEYMIPGNFEVELLVRDTNDCTATITKDLSYFPAPETLVIDLDGFEGCVPEDVFFDNLSFPIDSTYTIVWDFGDSTTSNEISPLHTYNESGVYSVSLDVTSPIGCVVSVPYNATIEIRDSPTAGFSYTPEILSNFQSEAFFTDESVGAEAWQWNFGDGTPPVYLQNPSHNFGTGEYEIMQVVRHGSGCYDTATVRIVSELLVTYYLPNAFTPNDDSKNEEFKGAGFFEGMTNFQMTIWNRWGEMIFVTNDPNEGWNGKKKNVGPIEQNGVYVVVVKYTDPTGVQINQKGFVTLIR
jgi:gliding motility-associated-like protein